jgi:hypothetical protein
MKNRVMIIHRLFLGLAILGAFLAGNSLTPPPNEPAKLTLKGHKILMEYEGKTLFQAAIHGEGIKYDTKTVTEAKNGRVTQLLIITTESFEESVEVVGEIIGSGESFPCETDRRDRGMAIVRHSFGLSHSLLNRGVYDRNRDWVLSVDHNPEVRITPRKDSPESRIFDIKIQGFEIILRFRPRFYQKHRGLEYYEPWTYKIWPKPIVGWCSWFAYFEGITEENIKKTADIMGEVLAPYGYEYLQIDDGYQQGEGLPEGWLQPNKKFPGGLEHLAEYIRKKGLKPGIWTNVAFDQEEFARDNKELFVLDDAGRVAHGNWIGISVDGSNTRAVDQIIRPVYRGLRDKGWEYFKVDALRHLRYEGYNSFPEYFKKKGTDRVEAYRRLVQAIREEIGRENFMLGCWGIRPELIGIIDGCRIGTDGYSFAGLSQYNSFNNVIWRNDPDHIELSPHEAYRSTMVTSLTGSLFLLTDRPEVYRTDIVDPARRAAPVLFTYPGQIFDLDPSRSQYLERVDAEVSGSGPRIFDASRTPIVHLFLMEINKPFENWMLLGRTGGDDRTIPFGELGLEENRTFFVFEFWSKRLLGSFAESFSPGPIDPEYNCQLFCIRERQANPQVVATSRHITCGGYDLEETDWSGTALSGKSYVVAGDTYILYITEPQGYALNQASCDGGEIQRIEKRDGLRQISILPKKNGTISWKVEFERQR